MKILCFLLMIFPAVVSAESLIVNVTGVKPGEGDVRVGVFKNAEESPEGTYFKGVAVEGEAKTVRVEVDNLESGQFAVSVFQDIDGSEKLNKNIVGKPKEPYGFSGKWKSGAASFKDALIELESGGLELTINMK